MNKKIELSLLESQIGVLLDEKGISSNEFRGDASFKEWVLSVPLKYQGEDVSLYVMVSYDEPRTYRLCGSIPANSSSEFIDLKSVRTSDVAELLCDFELYLSFAVKGKIPPEYLPVQDTWIEQSCSVPKRFKNEIPLFQVVKEFELRRGRERLTVGRMFSLSREGTRVLYESPNIKEMVEAYEGSIVSVRTTRKDLIEHNNLASFEALKSYFDSVRAAESVQRTYHNIKRFEAKLRALSWQDDLEAIYKGSGEF